MHKHGVVDVGVRMLEVLSLHSLCVLHEPSHSGLRVLC
jgi:hypothetical protein